MTEEGKFTMEVAAKKILKIWEDCLEEFDQPDLATWQGVFDPIYGTVFFFNTQTKEKIGHGDTQLTKKQALEIATDHYIARQAEKEVIAVMKMRAREKELKKQEKAKNMLINAWKIRKSKKMMRMMMRAQFDKRIDPETSMPYYYHIFKRERFDEKPKLLGPEDLWMPDFVCIHDPSGDYFYKNVKQPWLSSFIKPQGYVLCCQCDTFFAERCV